MNRSAAISVAVAFAVAFAGPMPLGHTRDARAAGVAPVEAVQSTASITDTAIAFLRGLHDDDATLAIGGGRLDDRLRLGRCETPLVARLAPGSRELGRVTVQVRCPSAPAWRVHVPLEASRERELWTLARDVRRGETLGRDMLALTTVTLGRGESLAARAGTPVDSPDAWLGHTFSRDVRAGLPLSANVLTAPRLVERDATVRIRVNGPGLSIDAVGTALGDAALGERVAVRNGASGRVVEAIAVARDVVELARRR